MQDVFGCAFDISGDKPNQAVDAWNKLCHAFLSHSAETPTHLGNLLAADPDNVLGLCAKGFFMLLAGRKECLSAVDTAVAKVSEIEKRRGFLPPREAAYVESLKLAHKGQWYLAAKVLEGVFESEAHDAMAFKLVHVCASCWGIVLVFALQA